VDLNPQLQDKELLDALRDFTLNCPNTEIERFKPGLRDWGSQWIETPAEHLPVSGLLAHSPNHCTGDAQELLQTFTRHNQRLRWQQSYRKQDRVVPDAMLAAYGFAEIIGLQGPFISERIRAGIAIWGPRVNYPQHHHQAEEIYAVLSGSADFSFDNSAAQTRRAGDVVFVESDRRHGFHTTDESLVVLYLWQAGDLRQTSSFV
jgi:mannose-6-phosphate isomerase-like protein (cupin superfamily)